jgi:hypothetical protein
LPTLLETLPTVPSLSITPTKPFEHTFPANEEHTCARNYRPSFRENKPKTLVFYDWIRAFWVCFHKNAGLKIRALCSLNTLPILLNICAAYRTHLTSLINILSSRVQRF